MKFFRKPSNPLACTAVLGIILWGSIYLWQAIPALVLALGPATFLIAVYWTTLFLGVAFLLALAVLALLVMAVSNQHHLNKIKRFYREESLRQHLHQCQQECDYTVMASSQCASCCYLQPAQNNLN